MRKTYHFFAKRVSERGYIGTAYRVKSEKLVDYYDDFLINNDCIILNRDIDIHNAACSPFISPIGDGNLLADRLKRIIDG